MVIDINTEKEKRSCGKCQHFDSRGWCNAPDYEIFIAEAAHTGFCQGFEEKKRENNGE